MKEYFDLDLQNLLKVLDEKNIVHFKKDTGFSNENLEIIANIFFELDELGSDHHAIETDSITLFKHCQRIYEFIEYDERTYSIDRNLKITKIQSYLS